MSRVSIGKGKQLTRHLSNYFIVGEAPITCYNHEFGANDAWELTNKETCPNAVKYCKQKTYWEDGKDITSV